MIALALGAFLMLGLVNMFISSRASAQVETALARVQENGRFALDLISQDILRTGYTGCNSVRGSVDVLARKPASTDPVEYVGLRGYERTGAVWEPTGSDTATATILTTARDGTDVINLQTGVSFGRNQLTADITPSDVSFTISDNPDGAIEQNDLVLLAGCLTSHLIRVTNVPASSGAATLAYATAATGANSSSSIEPGYRYTAETELLRLEDVVWFVGDSGRVDNGYNVWSLYRLDLENLPAPAVEMIEGVEFMQLLYGERAGSGVAGTTRFVDAENVTNWDNVVAVRVAMLIQSYQDVRNEDDANSYVLLDRTIGATEHSGGRALRKVFSTTLTLRNKPYDL